MIFHTLLKLLSLRSLFLLTPPPPHPLPSPLFFGRNWQKSKSCFRPLTPTLQITLHGARSCWIDVQLTNQGVHGSDVRTESGSLSK